MRSTDFHLPKHLLAVCARWLAQPLQISLGFDFLHLLFFIWVFALKISALWL